MPKTRTSREFGDAMTVDELCRPLSGSEYSTRLSWSHLQCSTSTPTLEQRLGHQSQAWAAKNKKSLRHRY